MRNKTHDNGILHEAIMNRCVNISYISHQWDSTSFIDHTRLVSDIIDRVAINFVEELEIIVKSISYNVSLPGKIRIITTGICDKFSIRSEPHAIAAHRSIVWQYLSSWRYAGFWVFQGCPVPSPRCFRSRKPFWVIRVSSSLSVGHPRHHTSSASRTDSILRSW